MQNARRSGGELLNEITAPRRQDDRKILTLLAPYMVDSLEVIGNSTKALKFLLIGYAAMTIAFFLI